MSNENSLLIRALRRQPTERTPVWFMRQAGRYLPGYQRIRGGIDFLQLCKTPELAAEVSVEPLEVLDVDAVIIFSDILVPLEAMGLEVEFGDRGPCMSDPLRDRAAIEALKIPDPVESTGFVMDVIRAVHGRVNGKVPVIGFAGAPWTLSCYALEGSPSRTFAAAQRMIYESPADLHLLMEKIADTVISYLLAQVEAGANAVQLFDSWGGMLGHQAFEEFSLHYCRRIMEGLDGCGVPRILFIRGAGNHLEKIAKMVNEVGVEAVGLDEMTPPEQALTIFGDRCALQGNLPPQALFASEEDLRCRVRELLDAFRGHPGHVFNLGHGILPPTPVANVQAVVDEIRSYT
ncbi:MAG: uroporphyrinogen decarboxylase [Planctomycetota bacterium]|nr:uroporphyrinogen decarboxylase [Planctomycetota bacterium]